MASSLVIAGAGATPASAAPFSCDVNTIYTQNAGGEIRAVDVATPSSGVSGTAHATGQRANALGISADGLLSYTLDNATGTGGNNKQLAIYDAATGDTETKPLGDPAVPATLIRGAVSPITGIYYYAGSGEQSYLGAYDPATGSGTQVGVLNTGVAGNGDMAFGANGELYVLAEREIFVVQPGDLPTASGTADVPLTSVITLPQGTSGNGIAFGANGKLFVSQAGSIVEVDLSNGQILRTINTPGFSNTDMSSCSFPNTLTLQKDVVDRFNADDQFTLNIGGTGDNDITATTTGAATGLQSVIAGPVFVNANETYTVSETGAAGADLGNYDSSVSCVASDGTAVPTTGTAPSWSLVFPESVTGENVFCTITNDAHDPAVPGLELRKTSDPADGTAVVPGQTVTYTVEAENTGNTVLDPVTVSDDLSGVFAHADYQDDVTTEIDGTELTGAAAAQIDDDTLAWSGALEAGETVTITYSVIVNDDVEGESLENRVTASGTPPGPEPGTPGTPLTPPPATTEHPVAGFEIEKTANPESGATVQPGQVIEYTVTGTNTGAAPLNPATIADDLTDVLAHAEYNDDASATVGTLAPLAGNVLNWSGSLAPGASVEITYSVTVADDASGVVLNNVATGSGTPLTPDPSDPDGPGIPGEPIVPEPAETEHPAIGSGFELTKVATPAAGAVDPGNTITYTLTGVNTGDTVLDPATITDDLTQVLANASYNGDVAASTGSVEVDGNDLTWNGTLAVGASVEITYSVRVNDDAGGATLVNDAFASVTPQIPVDPRDPDSPTTPGTPITDEDEVTHEVNSPGFTLDKTVDPASGTAVDPGEVLVYTLTGSNTGETALDPVVITDDLSQVNAYGTITGDIVTLVNGAPAAIEAELDGDQLTWTGSLAVGETVTITYSVTVGPDAAGEVVVNTVSGEATVPGNDPEDPREPPVLTPPPVTTENPVNVPGFSVSKSSDPAPGTAVDPGSVVTYTVTGVNTGETALDPVEIVDDLSGVLARAAYNGDVTASSGDVTVSGDELAWAGSLAVGESVTITYSVTVNADAGGEILENRVTGTATPPGGVPPIETPPAVVTHPVNEPGFEVVKISNPAGGTAVDPGSVITYTVSGINTGETALDPVSIVDDMSGVLAHAVYNGDAAASVGDVTVSGDELAWAGSLAVGERVTITYSVTVNGDAGGEILENRVTGTATPPGVDPDDPDGQLTPPPVSVTHPVNEPGFDFSKTSDPRSGTSVATGEVVTYTLRGVNTGETSLDDVVITDDLSGVLAHAELQGSAVAEIGGETVAAPVIDGTRLSWSGSLAVGETVTITYSVKVNADAAGATLKNSAVATATPPGGDTITPPPGETEHPVKTPLAVTGERAMPWLAGIAALLLAGGGTMLVLRRRTAQS